MPETRTGAMLAPVEAHELRAWLQVNDYSILALARELRVNPSTIHRWLAGDTPIPRTVELSLRWLEHSRDEEGSRPE